MVNPDLSYELAMTAVSLLFLKLAVLFVLFNRALGWELPFAIWV